MIKEMCQVGLSRDLIIHPGETVLEYLNIFEMSQKELALRCDVTEKHISTIINGSRNITVSFARKLEYAFGIDADFWIKLQANYDKEVAEFEEINNISKEELDILKRLKDIKKEYVKRKLISPNLKEDEELLSFRRLFNVSNLTSIPKLEHIGAFRMQTSSSKIDPYITYAFEKYCELIDKDNINPNPLDLSNLSKSINSIKRIMFLDESNIIKKLTEVFYSFGINFYVVKSFKGAPIRGYVRKNESNGLSLYMTLRNKYADIFWFSLFHEIGHILNEDAKKSFIDYESMAIEIERKANDFAINALIDNKAYEEFLSKGDFSIESIMLFSTRNNVKAFVTIGRLMKDEIIKWNQYSDLRDRYSFDY